MKIVRYLLIGVMLFTAGCNVFDTDPESSEMLIGVWEHEVTRGESDELVLINTYTFPDLNNFSITEAHFNREGELQGYRQLVEGKYELNGIKLSFNSGSIYYSQYDTLYSTIEELVASGIRDTLLLTEYTTEFSNKGQVVKLIYECPPNALMLCVEPPVLRKQNIRMQEF